MTSFAWAVIGPGGIANRFAEAVQGTPGMHLHSVFGRRSDAAADFAARWARADRPAPVVATDVSSLLADPRVDGVYIATPHAAHAQAARAALLAGKPVLCEKPLTTSLAHSQALVDLARAQGVFLMEALWTRFLPVYQQVGQWLQQGAIGRVQHITSSFCFAAPFDPHSRIFDPQLGGGALLDIGIYNVAMSRWVIEQATGRAPAQPSAQAQGVLAPTGVDQRVSASLHFAGPVTAQLVCALDGTADNALRIFGERGHIEITDMFWAATHTTLKVRGESPITHEGPWRINGFEGEIEAAVRSIRAGLIECPDMPHDESRAIAQTLDTLMRQVGVR